VNYWYAYPVGHAIEGFRYCLGYKAADPALRVSLLLNGATAVDLAGCCDFLEDVYAVPYTEFWRPDGDPRKALVGVPREWDWVIDNHREAEASHDRFRGFREFFDASHEYFRVRHGLTLTGREPPTYVRNQQLRLELPEAARAAARETLAGRQAISVVLAGGSGQPSSFPSPSSWILILTELSRRFPAAALCLIGKLGGTGSTTAIGRPDLDRIASAVRAIDCFERPLIEQLALVEASSLFVSPHTGLGFAAVSVGTPWLTISGGQWHEYFFNGVPFYSVLPNTEKYPCFAHGGPLPFLENDADGEGPRTASMSAARIREDLPELIEAAERLIERRWSYEQALADYFPRLLPAFGGDGSRIFSFEGVHHAYV
jgi:hypothetical protein